jgi:hypothetical protein
MFRSLGKATLILGLMALSSFSGCQCQKKAKDNPGSPILAENAPTVSLPAQSLQAIRLTPEQVSRQIKDALEFDYGWVDGDGRFRDLILELNAVPLGGVDFITASRRDSSTKVQTLLIVRRIAMDVAGAVVWREAKPDAGPPLLFQHCDLRNDRPILPLEASKVGAERAALEAMEARWMAQLDDFYWRLYSRPPSEDERAAIRRTAVNIMQAERWPPTVWVAILYALLSSQEFWTI